jgi:CheY-like chemotaxis protein
MTVPGIRTALLVEDDHAWALLTREAFRDAAPEVTVEQCSTAQAALDRLSHRPWPDAVLLDLNLPDRGGLEVLQALRELPDAQSLVVVVLSASRAASDRAAVERFGNAAYREKPTSYSELRALASQIAAGEVERPGSAASGAVSPDDVGVERPLGGPEEP